MINDETLMQDNIKVYSELCAKDIPYNKDGFLGSILTIPMYKII